MLKRMKMAAALAALTTVFVSVAKAKQEHATDRQQIPAFMKCAHCKKPNCPIPTLRNRILLEQAGQFD